MCPPPLEADKGGPGRLKSKRRQTGLEGKPLYDVRRIAMEEMVRARVSGRVAMEIGGYGTGSIFDRFHIRIVKKALTMLPFRPRS
jgi:hypothetical protein